MFGLETEIFLLLIVCLFAACAFEFVNGFHDTANAVATVIYTNSLKPKVAVIWSGFWNFFGVMRGGIEVAMGIVLLLPLEALATQSSYFAISMILALLGSAIIWNLGTWYFGIPCSSSHTLIGSILGVGLAYSWMPENISGAGVNWSKAGDIGLSLLLSPFIGFCLSWLLMIFLTKWVKNKDIFKEPKPEKKPPFLIRGLLILTCTGVSYAHGNNDGQKGVGLIMVILIALMPLKYAIKDSADLPYIKTNTQEMMALIKKAEDQSTVGLSKDKLILIEGKLSQVISDIGNKTYTSDLNAAEISRVRANLTSSMKDLNKLYKDPGLNLSKPQLAVLSTKMDTLEAITDYAPNWVIVMISLSLGLGTMIGWKRIVVTIGEKIGKTHLTYAQGASSEVVTAGTIFAATGLGLPVSTTQVLTTAVAGAMTSKDGLKNLQPSTLKNILLAWILTFPVCMMMSAGFFYVLKWILV